MIYRIRVEGRLGPEWSERGVGMTVEVRTARGRRTTSDLVGPVADEAQLMGILDELYTHGARLLKIDRIGEAGSRGRTETTSGAFAEGRAEDDRPKAETTPGPRVESTKA